jgi:site-specific DNA-methyltransferase (adenine-specific)
VEHACKLIRGDLLVELIDRHGVRAIDIARQTGERPADLSQMYRTAKAFPRDTRPVNVPYNILMLGAWMSRRFPELNLQPIDAVDEIMHAGLSQHRDVTRHFAAFARRQLQHEHVGSERLSDDSLINQAHHCRFQDLLPRFPDRSIRIFHIDPPYVYGNQMYRSRSARSRDCDSDSPSAAIEVVIDLLQVWQPKLACGGVALLWQPWGALPVPISQAVDEYGWVLSGPVIWDKGRTQPGRFVSLYSSQGEFLWVLHRLGDRLSNYSGSSRDSILRLPPVSLPHQSHRQRHAFEKPVPLCEFLVRKHSRPGDLIFDACGCTGTMSIAAINSGRRWVYAESNEQNYRFGTLRIAGHLAAMCPQGRVLIHSAGTVI